MKLIVGLFLLLTPPVYSQDLGSSNESPRFIVHLLDYLAKDYGGAVSEDGKVLSEFEYNEQVEFAVTISATSKKLQELKSQTALASKITELEKLIKAKAGPSKVTPLARSLQVEMIQITGIALTPTHWPKLEVGKQIYKQNCILCHGENGLGDGAGGEGMDPAPANFVDKEGMQNLTPFAAYNTIRLGVPGTGMPPFALLSDDEVWAVSFYVNSIRHLATKAEALDGDWDPNNKETLDKVSSLSDLAIIAQIDGSDAKKEKVLASLRLFSPSDEQNSFLMIAKTKLLESQAHYERSEFEDAKNKSLQAYLEGIEPVEPKIKATDPDSLVRIEEKMSLVRSGIDKRLETAQLKAHFTEALLEIEKIAELTQNQEIAPSVAFAGAFGIILREGFEAVLIILALLGIIKATGSRRAALWVHSGWISAVGLGVIAWFFSGWLMKLSGASRETLEGVTSVLAVVVLLYVGFWLHRQTEVGRWKEFIEVTVKGFLDKEKLAGLALIAFIATFREAFETVLFLRAIWVDTGPEAKNALGLGVASSFALVIILSWAALTYSKRLPLKKLFTVSSLLMLALATILAGKGLHSLQESGLIGITPLPFRIRWELVGLYPTIESVVAQVATFAMVILLWVLGSREASSLKNSVKPVS